jgi:putative colanic acid biosysnthesis UDP-glucose lipid carrier transferase
MIRGFNAAQHIIQRLTDLIILIVLTFIVGDRLVPKELARVLAVYCSLLLFVVFSFFHMYQSWRQSGILHHLRRLAAAWLTVLVIFNLIIILLSNKEQLAVLTPFGLFISTGFNVWALVVFGGLAIARLAAHTAFRIIRSRGYNQQVAVIIGAGDTGQKLARYLRANPWIGISVAGFFDDELLPGTTVQAGKFSLGTVLGQIEECHDFIVDHAVGQVFLALPMSAEQKITRIVGSLGTSGHTVLLVQDLFSFGIQKARTQHLGELQVLDFYLFPLWKRTFDIFFSIAVILISLPIWIAIMIAIKVEDGGPVFFRHPRVMEGGKRFECLKFRSMHHNAQHRLQQLLDRDLALRQEWQRHYKLKNDPRVTKAGRLLRRYRLDELPQFLNVLTGEMSVVGARPVVPEELEKYYREVTLTYCAMKPGITGLWQVSANSDTMDYAERVELDRRYILNCSLWTDIRIIIKTVGRIVLVKAEN